MLRKMWAYLWGVFTWGWGRAYKRKNMVKEDLDSNYEEQQLVITGDSCR